MADNIALMDGAGARLASDDVDGVQVLRCKLQTGDDGTATDVSEDGPLPVEIQATGLSAFQAIGLGATGQVAKDSPSQLFGWHLANSGSSGVFVKVYDAASAPEVGTDTPLMTFFVPATGVVASKHPNGITFENGISVAATTGADDADAEPPTAGSVVANLFFA